MILRMVVLLVAFACTSCLDLHASDNTFAVCMNYGEVQFREFELGERVYNRVVAEPRLQIVPPFMVDSVVAENVDFQQNLYVPGNMSELAEQLGVRYVVWVKVESAGSEQRDVTLLPYVFQSHKKKYKVTVHYYILDSASGETVVSEFVESKRNGPSTLSYMDIDKKDPKLFEPYSRVKRAFAEMEEEISDKIALEIVKLSHAR